MPLIITPLQTTAQNSKAQTSDEEIWQQWMAWLPTAPPVDNMATVLREFRAHQVASGFSAEEADWQLTVVIRLNHDRTDGRQVIFNKIYSNSTPGFSTQPSGLLVTTVEGRNPGRALDIGMGQGRNSVFLALKGWDVTGFDISDEGITVARKNAERAGVKLNAVCESDKAFDYGSNQWDLIAFIYGPFPVTTAAYVERLHKSMKVGGVIVIESFCQEVSTPNRPSTVDPGQLLAAFKDFRLLFYEDTLAKSEWRPPDAGETRIVRMVAEKRP